MEPDIIEFNKENNKGRVKIDMNQVKDYQTDENSQHRATKINLHDGTSIIVADTVEQIEVLKKWKEDGTIDRKGNFIDKDKKKKK